MTEENITLYPVAEWSTSTLPEGNAMLTIGYLPGIPPIGMTTEQMRAATLFHRYGMTAEQCDELAELLRKTAERSRARRGASN